MLLFAAQILQKPYKAQNLELLQHITVMLWLPAAVSIGPTAQLTLVMSANGSS